MRALVSAITHPLRYHRSKELLLRWIELNAFTAVFRTHEGNRPAANAQVYSDDETIGHFSRFARVYREGSAEGAELAARLRAEGVL
jgi:hypothetical protein